MLFWFVWFYYSQSLVLVKIIKEAHFYGYIRLLIGHTTFGEQADSKYTYDLLFDLKLKTFLKKHYLNTFYSGLNIRIR